MDFKEYFRTKSLLKTPNTGVHYKQKITPDLIWCVSHVVLNLVENDQSRVFTDKDIRRLLPISLFDLPSHKATEGQGDFSGFLVTSRVKKVSKYAEYLCELFSRGE